MRTLIIAEAGVNHNGSIHLAKKLIEVAAEAGVDMVKFQTFRTGNLVSVAAQRAGYQKTDKGDDSQYKMLSELELDVEIHHLLVDYCRELGVQFLSTPFDHESIDLLESLDIPLYKVPSGEITDKPFLSYIASKGRPVIMSTGMATIDEVRDAVALLKAGGICDEDITLLHCNSGYPTPMEDVNLKAMLTLGRETGLRTGYSDHTPGIEVAIAAVALGATVIEKHITLDRSLPGPDHRASLEPGELSSLVSSIRNIERALSGDGRKQPTPSETPNIVAARKSIHLAAPVKAGQEVTASHLVMKRPGDGISPMEMDRIIGMKYAADLAAETKLSWDDLRK